MLDTGRRLTISDMMRLQHDVLSIPARSLVPMLLELELAHGPSREAVARLQGWDYVLDKRSIPAGIYVEFERRVLANVRSVIVPPAVGTNLNVSMKRTVDWLLTPDRRFGEDPIAGRNGLLSRSMDEAVTNLTQKLGPDMGGWQYGQEKYKHATLRHPLSAAVSPEIKALLEVGTLPRGGNQYTPMASGAGDNQAAGASVRIIAPVDDWDLAVGTQTPGQSGDPDSPHYRDLYPLWATGQYFPVFFSREKVQRVADVVALLAP
jgi:penicillin amidase